MNFIDTLDNSPTDLIGSKYGVVVFAAKDFDDWCESLAIAHDDEVYIASNAYLEDIPDERLTKNGLVRLPVDADGVTWTGGEKEFSLPSGEIKKFAAIAYGGGFWDVIDMDGRYSTALSCRHVPDEPADPHASLADEIVEWWAHDQTGPKLEELIDRLREMGGGE